MQVDHIDWGKTSKETCIEIIAGLREELKALQYKYDERTACMRETSDMVRSLYVPKIRQILSLWTEHETSKFKSDGSHFQVDIKINQLMIELRGLVG